MRELRRVPRLFVSFEARELGDVAFPVTVHRDGREPGGGERGLERLAVVEKTVSPAVERAVHPEAVGDRLVVRRPPAVTVV